GDVMSAGARDRLDLLQRYRLRPGDALVAARRTSQEADRIGGQREHTKQAREPAEEASPSIRSGRGWRDRSCLRSVCRVVRELLEHGDQRSPIGDAVMKPG